MTNEERIEKHRKQVPKDFLRVYDIAMAGRSLRAAVNSQCIECMGYSLKEVRLCCSPQCPLFPYRPLGGVAENVDSELLDHAQGAVESTNSTPMVPDCP